MSIGHVVTFTFTPSTSRETIAQLSTALDALAASCTGIETYRHGPDLGIRDGNAHYAVAAVFRDAAAFAAYMSAPEHLQLVADLIQPNLTAKSSVQFECHRPVEN